MKYLKNILFILLLAVIVLIVFGVSYKIGFFIGDKILVAYKTTVKGSLQQKNVNQNSKEMLGVAVVPKAYEPVEGKETKSGFNESAPIKIVGSASDKVEKVSNPGMQENIVQLPTKKIVAPAARAEKPTAGEVKSGVKESTPVKKIVEPVSGQVQKVSNPVMEKNMVQPVQKIVASVAKVEKPAEAAKPEVSKPKKIYAKRAAVREKISTARGREKINANDYRGAIKILNAVIAKKPDESINYRLRGNAFDNLDNRKRAVEDWKKAAALGDTIIQSYLRFLEIDWQVETP